MNNKKRSSNRQTQASSKNQNLQFNHIKNIPFCFPASSPRAWTVHSLQPKQPSCPTKHLNDKNQLSLVMLRKVLTLLKQNTQHIAVGSHNPETGHLSGTSAEALRWQDTMCLLSGLKIEGYQIHFIMRNPIHHLWSPAWVLVQDSFSTPETAQMKKEQPRPKPVVTGPSRVHLLTRRTPGNV